jgi:hypothetical protein
MSNVPLKRLMIDHLYCLKEFHDLKFFKCRSSDFAIATFYFVIIITPTAVVAITPTLPEIQVTLPRTSLIVESDEEYECPPLMRERLRHGFLRQS